MARKSNSSRYAAQQAFKVVSRFISSLSDEEFASLLDGSATLAVIPNSEAAPDQNKSKEREYSEERIRQIVRNLEEARTTEEGISILIEANLSRAVLEKIVRSLDIPVMKQDSISRLEEKVIEGLVGSRLNSKAVRGS